MKIYETTHLTYKTLHQCFSIFVKLLHLHTSKNVKLQQKFQLMNADWLPEKM